jgi:thiamine pyrophosphate-dependent acetolactate synthase large subunit-like protein
VPFAEDCGAKGHRIETQDEIAPTLNRALAMEVLVVIGNPLDCRDNHMLMDIVHPNGLT